MRLWPRPCSASALMTNWSAASASIHRACARGYRWREPFSTVDPDSALQIARLLADMRSGGTTNLLITHQIGLLANLADEYLMLSHGQLVDRGFMPGIQP